MSATPFTRRTGAIAVLALVLQLTGPTVQLGHEAGHADAGARPAHSAAWLEHASSDHDSDVECFLCEGAAHAKHLGGAPAATSVALPVGSGSVHAPFDQLAHQRDLAEAPARGPPLLLV